MKNNSAHQLLIVAIIILLSRLPFIFTGFGSEEDAWGLALTAEQIDISGKYEVSRLPGHPFQEILYSYIYQHGFLLMNLLTVLISTGGFICFYLLLANHKVANPFYATMALAFVPVIYINSTNVMDYTWAMSAILCSAYLLSGRQMLLSGILLGVAIGCRITSGAMLLPYILYLIFDEKKLPVKEILILTLTTLITSLICFLPVIKTYGISFFAYYEHFPIPALVKNLYKGTIGVMGTAGSIVLFALLFLSLRPVLAILKIKDHAHRPLMIMSVCAALLYIIAFARLPLKSAFMIPAMPFLILIIVLSMKQQHVKWLFGSLIISCFFIGVNLTDPNRGSPPSIISYSVKAAGQMVSFDLLKGPVIADCEKQKAILDYTAKVIQSEKDIDEYSVVIAGWYLNFIQYQRKEKPILPVQYVYYIDEDSIDKYLANKYHLYYLPLQDQFNDLRFNMQNTASVADKFPD